MVAPMFVQREIKKAVEAERERCAKIAEQTKTVTRQVGGIFTYGGPSYYDEIVPRWRDGEEIATAIRKAR